MKRILDDSPSTFEYLYGYASTPNSQLVLLGIYRPGSAPLTPKFFNELSTVFEQLVSYSCPVVVCRDFNVHFDLCDDGNAVHLRDTLQSFGFVQHVTEPTHVRGHTLDLVITRRSETDVLSLRVEGLMSDRALVRHPKNAKWRSDSPKTDPSSNRIQTQTRTWSESDPDA